jgi:hypothetical protein
MPFVWNWTADGVKNRPQEDWAPFLLRHIMKCSVGLLPFSGLRSKLCTSKINFWISNLWFWGYDWGTWSHTYSLYRNWFSSIIPTIYGEGEKKIESGTWAKIVPLSLLHSTIRTTHFHSCCNVFSIFSPCGL